MSRHEYRNENKAHTATGNRIAQRYRARFTPHDGHDIVTDTMIIEIETTATLPEAVARLAQLPTCVYVAVTNQDGVREARRWVRGTSLGVMDPQGEIVIHAADDPNRPGDESTHAS